MKSYLSLLAICLWLSTTLCALDSLNVRLLNAAISLPPQAGESIEDIAVALLGLTNSDFERAEIAAYWMTEHFDYDIEAESAASPKDLDITTVLRQRKGNMQTFSQLYVELCRSMKLKAYLVPGYYRNIPYSRFEQGEWLVSEEYYDGEYLDLPERPYHTWVAVKVDQTYYLTDISLGMGQLVGDFGAFKFERKRDINMLLVKGDAFRTTHLPADPVWQMLERPVPIREFYRKLPYREIRTQEPYAENFDYQSLLTSYEKASPARQRLLQLERSADFYNATFNLRQAADAQYNMGYTLSLESYSDETMMAARRYYRQAIKTYGQLEQNNEVETLISQAKQGITYVEYRLESKQ